ncbi:MAG TPA: right-handed parallel beta-helix repeat-containing protein [Clostridia bacterium]|nr:right-handed parallel beta-helix repeat-containing protein [Clostridia bacterium]HOT70571.1 right-handed parallel beta-helix repeat-containing protein [Clostridia bacterium]HQG00138.1 right-handed parallel beta-helix repeat-containing protein [Clostridia bacterium]HQH66260.1 right-handed parallel beta-helix repeat-containing protein [Clostridia bacterium]HQJ92135.1 right-handed parallel beta-helix repeat-containing protein [Clostridia bacterium]
MKYYVDVNAVKDGDGSKERPFKRLNEAAKIARPGDEVLVAPGIYREYVDPVHSGTEDARITYISTTPLGAVITGAEQVKNWQHYKGNVWMCRIPNSLFGDYNPYTTLVYGDWYFATPNKHTGCVFLNDKAMYEATTLEECIKGEVYECSWVPEESIYKWYAEQDPDTDETIIYANFQGLNPNEENVEITVRRRCFMPSKTGVSYITIRGFRIDKAATTWAPPAAFQDGMIGPHWSKGWIIEDCEISNSKCAGISLGKYLDPDNEHYFTNKHVKSPTQMERDAVCRGQYHGWLKENIGSHIIRRCNIHHCEQGGIIGRMGSVFSIIEDNHIHHINNMQELGGAEISGIKLHAAIDVIIRRNHIHHCTMGIWCDWEAQGTRITQNLLHDNQRPPYAKKLEGGMNSQDIFVEVSHGPTLIDNNILLSDVSLRFATQGVALVHNLICGAFTSVGGGTTWRYTPYHIPHRTEVMGFMTILHGDNRFYNNIFIQKWPSEDYVIHNDHDPQRTYRENRLVGTHVFDEYPNYDEWISQFDFSKRPDMRALEPVHFGHLPIWSEGNVYLNGAKQWKKDVNYLLVENNDQDLKVELVEKDGQYYLCTNIFDYFKDFNVRMINSEVLGKAFEPEQYYENPDGTPIRFDTDYFGNHRGVQIIPGPFASPSDEIKL